MTQFTPAKIAELKSLYRGETSGTAQLIHDLLVEIERLNMPSGEQPIPRDCAYDPARNAASISATRKAICRTS